MLYRMMRFLLIILFPLTIFAQRDRITNRQLASLQFGGQMTVAFNYEYSIVCKKHFLLNVMFSPGINKFENRETRQPAIYGVQTGIVSLIGKKHIYFEASFVPTSYFYRSLSFVNLNGWAGVRLITKRFGFVSVCYTPRLFTSYSDSDKRFFNSSIGVKAGFDF